MIIYLTNAKLIGKLSPELYDPMGYNSVPATPKSNI
jgi:hypothetical protein